MTEQSFFVTPEEAENILSKAKPGSEFAVFVWMPGYSQSDAVRPEPGDVCGHVYMSRKSMIEFTRNCLKESARRRGIKLRLIETPLHVGKNGKSVTLYTIC